MALESTKYPKHIRQKKEYYKMLNRLDEYNRQLHIIASQSYSQINLNIQTKNRKKINNIRKLIQLSPIDWTVKK